MKNRLSLIGLVAGMVALTAAFEYGRAQPTAGPAVSTSKIGVVSLAGVLNKATVMTQYRTKQIAADNESRSRLQALDKQIQADEAQLDALKSTSDDYLKVVQTICDNQAKLDSQQKYLKQQRLVEDRKQLEKVYPEIIKAVTALAQEKKLDLVLERTEPSLSTAQTMDQMTMMISSYKALYAGGCVDLTDDVIARLDATVK
jgi:Skp family chaperone for outer membrane proteins